MADKANLLILILLGLVVVLLVASVPSVHCESFDDDPEAMMDDDDDDDDAPEVPEGMARENMIKYSTPDLNDEEAHSTRLPSNMNCDGCIGVVYQLKTVLSAFHDAKYKKKGKRAPESEIIELVEKICDKNTFENYGLKKMNGVNRLSGPGTEVVDEPGVMQGGGRWPFRLHQMCSEMVGEADEYEIYNFIVENGPDKLFSLLCEDSDNEALNSCGKSQRKDEL